MEDNHANEKLVSLSQLREFTSQLERWDSRITLVQGSLTVNRQNSSSESLSTKAAELEEIRSEKRILLAEREDLLKRLLSVQYDLESVKDMEQKFILETQKLDRDIRAHQQDEEYVELREKVSELRKEHDLPELPALARNRDEEHASYLQTRLNDR